MLIKIRTKILQTKTQVILALKVTFLQNKPMLLTIIHPNVSIIVRVDDDHLIKMLLFSFIFTIIIDLYL